MIELKRERQADRGREKERDRDRETGGDFLLEVGFPGFSVMKRIYPLRALPKEQGEQDTLKIESNSESDRENKNENEKETESVNNEFSISTHIHNILGRKLDFWEDRASVSLF